MAQNDLTQRDGDAATAEQGAGGDCQQRVDAKAFTGRGRAGTVASHQAELDRLHAEMGRLAGLTKDVPGRSFYLAVHRRAVNGQHSLRWRSVLGNRHLPWNRMQALFAAQLPTLAAWYVTVQARVAALNQEECALRSTLRYVGRRG